MRVPRPQVEGRGVRTDRTAAILCTVAEIDDRGHLCFSCARLRHDRPMVEVWTTVLDNDDFPMVSTLALVALRPRGGGGLARRRAVGHRQWVAAGKTCHRLRYDDGPVGVLSSSVMDNVLVLGPAGGGNTRCDTYSGGP